jgi:hypothetical protein
MRWWLPFLALVLAGWAGGIALGLVLIAYWMP